MKEKKSLSLHTQLIIAFAIPAALLCMTQVFSYKSIERVYYGNMTKTYFVRLQDEVPQEAMPLITRRFADGIHIEPDGDDGEYDCKPADLEWIDGKTCKLIITEGRYHQVKRMIAAAGNKVVYLQRLAVGKLNLDTSLEKSSYRELTFDEVELLG